MGRALLLLTFLNIQLITKVCSDSSISKSGARANDCVTKSSGTSSENQPTSSEQSLALCNQPLTSLETSPLTSSEALASSEKRPLASLVTRSLDKRPLLTSLKTRLMALSNVPLTSPETPPLTLFHQDGKEKGTLVEMKNLPVELQTCLRSTGNNLDTEYRYGTINTKKLDTTSLSKKLRAPFLFVAHLDSTKIEEEMKTFVFILFHGLSTTSKKDPGFNFMVKTLLEMLNYNYEHKNVRYIFFCPNYSEESRISLRTTMTHVVKVLVPFVEMLKADKLIVQCSFHLLGHSMGGIVIRMLMAKPVVGHPFDDMKELMGELKKIQTNFFNKERDHKLRVVSVVSVGSPHWGIGRKWYSRWFLKIVNFFKPNNSLAELSHNDRKKVLFKLALAESNEAIDMSYMKTLGLRVCFYAGRGDEVVGENSALGLTVDQKLPDELETQDMYIYPNLKTAPVRIDANTLSEAQLEKYIKFRTNRIPSDTAQSIYGTSLLLSKQTYQRFLFDFMSVLKKWVSIRSIHNNMKGASIKDLGTETKLKPFMHHVVSKLVCPLATVKYDSDYIDGCSISEVSDNPEFVYQDKDAFEEDMTWRLSYTLPNDNE